MKKEIEKDIIALVEKMESNGFLLPDSWSSEIQMSSFDWKYKTYVGSRGNSRYINIEVIFPMVKYEFHISGKNVSIRKPISDKSSAEKLFSFIQEIYNEIHSFQNHSQGKRDIRKKISDKLKQISELKKEVEVLRKRLLDSNL